MLPVPFGFLPAGLMKEVDVKQQWYYQRDGAAKGPLSREQLLQLLASGSLPADSSVIRDGMKDWGDAESLGLVPGGRSRRQASNWSLLACAGAILILAGAAAGWLARGLSDSPHNRRNETAVANNDVAGSEKEAQVAVPVSDSHDATADDELASGEKTPAETKAVDSAQEVPPFDQAAESLNPIVPPRTGQVRNGLKQSPETAQPESESPPPASPNLPSALVTRPEKPTPQETEVSPDKFQTLFQEVHILRQPKFSVLGTVFAQDLRYKILSELHVGQADQRGGREVEQIVLETELVKGDPLSKAMMQESLRALKGWKFSYRLNSKNEVVEFDGAVAAPKAVAAAPAGLKGITVTSVMDVDGWREMAELSFLQPDPQGLKRQCWIRQITHDFGPLGHWSGKTKYSPGGTKQGLLQINYQHDLKYQPPVKGKADGLPLTIKKADLKVETADGIISYDTRLGRVQTAQERFQVEGALITEVLGRNSTVQLEEKQLIWLRLHDQNPWKH